MADPVTKTREQYFEGHPELTEADFKYYQEDQALTASRDQAWDKFLGSGEVTDINQKSYAERSALAPTGDARITGSYFDQGSNIYAPSSKAFALYGNGAVRIVDKPTAPQTPEQLAADAARAKTSLFDDPNDPNASGVFNKENLGYTPAEGKTIARTGQTIKNPVTGVDEQAGEGEVLIQYTDNTVERRKIGGGPGSTEAIGEFGRSAEELGITRRTEIKGGEGTEVTRGPQSAGQVLQDMIAKGADPQAIDEFLQSEGESSTADLQHVGKTYRGQTAKEGYDFYVDPKTKEILQRPSALSKVAQPLTVAGVAGTKIDVVDKFKAVFGRDPNGDELKYWMGRTDKAGSALIGAMQFAKQNGGGMGKVAGAAIADPVEAMKAQANAAQGKLAQTYTDAGISTRSDELSQRRAELEALKAPESQPLTIEQLNTSQLQEAMDDLNRTKDSIRQLDTDYRSNLVAAERTPGLSMGAIRRNQQEFDVVYNRARAELVDELSAHNDIVQSQQAMVGITMDIFKYNQAQAQQDYANRFQKAMSMYEIAVGERAFAFDVQQQADNTARQNLSVVMGLMQEGVLDYNQLNSDQKLQITNMEQRSGLQGITAAMAATKIPPVVSVGSTVTDANGIPRTQLISQDPKTGEISISYYQAPFTTKEAKTGGGTGSSSTGGGKLSVGVLNKYKLPTNTPANEYNTVIDIINASPGDGGWGSTADAISAEGINPSKYDELLWEVFTGQTRTQGTAAATKASQKTTSGFGSL